MRTILAMIAAAAAWTGLATTVAASPAAGSRSPSLQLPIEQVGPTVASNPDWVKRPTGEEVANYYPPVASVVGVSGHVTIQCAVQTTGFLANCRILAETPAGMGFGDAALAMAKLFQMKPMTVNGQPVAGGEVVIPIGFQMPRPAGDDAPLSLPGPEPTAHALVLAHQISAATIGDGSTLAANMRASLGARFADTALTEQEQAASTTTWPRLAATSPNGSTWMPESWPASTARTS